MYIGLMTSPRPYTYETLTGDLARGQFPPVRMAMLEFVGQYLLDFEKASQAAGLTLAQTRVLGFAAMKPSSMGEIAEQFGCDPSNITAKADRLVELGLAERRPDPSDGRVKLIAATPEGVQMSKQICDSRDWLSQLLAGMTDDEVETVQQALRLLTRIPAPADREKRL